MLGGPSCSHGPRAKGADASIRSQAVEAKVQGSVDDMPNFLGLLVDDGATGASSESQRDTRAPRK